MAKKRRLILIGVLCLIGFKPFYSGAEVGGDLKLPLAYLPSAHFEFEPVVEGKEVIHDFVIQNKGEALLQVRSVKTD
ncbi:MAG: hypothetical protein P8X68_14890 [Desulfobacterales bacterium]|jgi:hypothetical protein